MVAPDATLPLIEVTVREGSDSAGRSARVSQRARVIFKEDSAAVDDVGGNGIQTRLFGTEAGAVPYLNLSFALLEQAVRRARVAAVNRVSILQSGRRTDAHRQARHRWRTDSLTLDIGGVENDLRVDPTGRVLGGRIRHRTWCANELRVDADGPAAGRTNTGTGL